MQFNIQIGQGGGVYAKCTECKITTKVPPADITELGQEIDQTIAERLEYKPISQAEAYEIADRIGQLMAPMPPQARKTSQFSKKKD
jgi:hypothetical protein